MVHVVAIRDGMGASGEVALSNVVISFINASGVVGTNDYSVQAQLTPDNTVKINTGRAYVPTTDLTMKYATYLSASENVTIAANVSGNPRIDALVMYIDLAAAPDATASNVAKFYDVLGTPAGSPVAPDNTAILAAIGAGNPYIILSNLALTNGFTSIIGANITDTRTFTTFNTGPTLKVPQYIEMTDQAVAPASPLAGKVRLYSDGDTIYRKVPGGGIAQIGNTSINPLGSITGAVTVDFSVALNHSVIATGPLVFTFNNPVDGEHYVIKVTNGDLGMTFPGNVIWSTGGPPAFGTGVNKIDLLGFFYDSTIGYIGMTATRY